jgi:two-component system CheB/CheR fusion protein
VAARSRIPRKSSKNDTPAPRSRKGRSATEPVSVSSDSTRLPTLPIVGVGASAGGLEAFTQLLQGLPADLGLAIVFVQHLAPQHESALPILLGNVSKLKVVQVTEGMKVTPNCVYVIPPNARLTLTDGELHLAPRTTDRTQYNPIDLFFRSLADSAGDRSIAVVLSGTASDGASGTRDVKAAGGITIAQLPETARYDGMPRAAIATGLVDLVLAPPDIANLLVQIARHPYVQEASAAPVGSAEDPPSTLPDATPIAQEQLERIFALLRGASGVDFKQYKLPTILRRLHRRMALQKTVRLSQYLQFLEEHPGEVLNLYNDILIHVTRFFREPESFAALRTLVCPEIIAKRKGDSPIRVWISGCATGEEAYSVAIELLEALDAQPGPVPIQIFATDVSDAAIEHARNGVYPESISADVSPERLRRYFVEVDGGYRVSKQLRELCVFARQDLTRDPPFSKLDLILCRNVLIYMNAALQRKLMGVFHYALKSSGFLMLGHAETIGSHSDLFAITDKRHRIYTKKSSEDAPLVSFPVEYSTIPTVQTKRSQALGRADGRTIQSEANRLVLDRYAPAGVLVDSELQIVQFRGQTGPYLEPAPGDPSLSVLKMAREGLLSGLRSALDAARKHNTTVRRDGLRVRQNGGWREVNLQVLPLTSVGERAHYLVLFEDPAARPAQPKRAGAPAKSKRSETPQESRVVRLREEIAASRDYLQSIIQELEAANEELQSANEEILSSNEELQSTNEELDTAKEELQSTNEELNTVNEELHGRNEELARANSDLLNLLASVDIAIVIVSNESRIRRFTPMAERVLNLIPSDVGRPISHIKPNIDCPQLEQLIADAIDRVVAQACDVQDREGNWYSLRVRPYKNVENRIDGAVLTLFDLNASRKHEQELAEARRYAQAVVETVLHPLVLLDPLRKVRAVNQAFCDAFAVRRADLEDQDFLEFGEGSWNVPELRAALEHPPVDGQPLPRLELEHVFPRVGHKRLTLNMSWLDRTPGDLRKGILIAMSERSDGREPKS